MTDKKPVSTYQVASPQAIVPNLNQVSTKSPLELFDHATIQERTTVTYTDINGWHHPTREEAAMFTLRARLKEIVIEVLQPEDVTLYGNKIIQTITVVPEHVLFSLVELFAECDPAYLKTVMKPRGKAKS